MEPPRGSDHDLAAVIPPQIYVNELVLLLVFPISHVVILQDAPPCRRVGGRQRPVVGFCRFGAQS